ncbi:polysaccharide deacetylase family protein [Pseudodesulfovibrio sp. F-1]|uniref:Polysaccharide deacetylase family protein n=1 Tax=Pseudodesulfovibrio alkaliphilus TaxID=2661613 RepID=A0A7K1KLY4_9BACT|nr:polysaccharide deacetylase family protein [Pseudodesulfovibrio alkaliphilus]MUM77098.1 polysaccharide deacetylase family protein [Pseudodesulfovibrio alkaliphilus]
MIVKTAVSALWCAPQSLLEEGLRRLDALFAQAGPGVEVFFRADDVAAPGEACARMLKTFSRHGVPLHLAVTPAWLTPARWKVLRRWAGDGEQWCWHQHGWRHVNHQRTGRKGEFGDGRTLEAKRADLARGRTRLEAIMGAWFSPVFTPPWNRFDAQTAGLLHEAGYVAVSRWAGAQRTVPTPEGLPDIAVNVDLHTRREPDPAEGLEALLREVGAALASGRAGFMLHHQRMNDAAFIFLDRCLSAVAASRLAAIRLDRPGPS